MNKYCTKCKNSKPITEFWKNRTTQDGYQSWCNVCWREITATRRNGPKREIELRQRMNRHLMRKYNISIEEYEKLWQSQGGKCKICGNPVAGKKKLAVDHCHAKGNIRGLLCENCNRGLGMFKDNIDTLNKAIEYLK